MCAGHLRKLAHDIYDIIIIIMIIINDEIKTISGTSRGCLVQGIENKTSKWFVALHGRHTLFGPWFFKTII